MCKICVTVYTAWSSSAINIVCVPTDLMCVSRIDRATDYTTDRTFTPRGRHTAVLRTYIIVIVVKGGSLKSTSLLPPPLAIVAWLTWRPCVIVNFSFQRSRETSNSYYFSPSCLTTRVTQTTTITRILRMTPKAMKPDLQTSVNWPNRTNHLFINCTTLFVQFL